MPKNADRARICLAVPISPHLLVPSVKDMKERFSSPIFRPSPKIDNSEPQNSIRLQKWEILSKRRLCTSRCSRITKAHAQHNGSHHQTSCWSSRFKGHTSHGSSRTFQIRKPHTATVSLSLVSNGGLQNYQRVGLHDSCCFFSFALD